MGDTMSPRTGSRKYRRQDAALGRYVAEGGSRSLAGAHAKELRTWASARQLIACYCRARAERAIERLRACIAYVVRPVTPARILEVDAADRAEDAAEVAYLLAPNASTRETLIRAKHDAIAKDTELARDLAAQQDGAS
jgi:hypothetical protein